MRKENREKLRENRVGLGRDRVVELISIVLREL